MEFNAHKQFFSNEAILGSLGYSSGLTKNDRYVHYSTKEEEQYIKEVAQRIQDSANEWLKKETSREKTN